jgi:hypothetical protein
MNKVTDVADADRRRLLLRLDKWSRVVLGGVVGDGLPHFAAARTWIDIRHRVVAGDWINSGGGGWVSRRRRAGRLDAR